MGRTVARVWRPTLRDGAARSRPFRGGFSARAERRLRGSADSTRRPGATHCDSEVGCSRGTVRPAPPWSWGSNPDRRERSRASRRPLEGRAGLLRPGTRARVDGVRRSGVRVRIRRDRTPSSQRVGVSTQRIRVERVPRDARPRGRRGAGAGRSCHDQRVHLVRHGVGLRRGGHRGARASLTAESHLAKWVHATGPMSAQSIRPGATPTRPSGARTSRAPPSRAPGRRARRVTAPSMSRWRCGPG